jgi:hypothetical protein
MVGLGPGARIVALHLRSVSTRSTDVRGRFGEARVAVEASAGAQADENLARTAPLQALLQLHRVVARVEDEHGSGLPFLGRPAEERFDLLRGNLVGLPRGVNARNVHGSSPTLAHEVELGDELVSTGKPIRPRWAARRSGGMGGSRSRARGCFPRRSGATRSHPRRRRVVCPLPRRAGHGRAGRVGPRRLLFHAPMRRRGCPIRDDGTPGG